MAKSATIVDDKSMRNSSKSTISRRGGWRREPPCLNGLIAVLWDGRKQVTGDIRGGGYGRKETGKVGRVEGKR